MTKLLKTGAALVHIDDVRRQPALHRPARSRGHRRLRPAAKDWAEMRSFSDESRFTLHTGGRIVPPIRTACRPWRRLAVGCAFDAARAPILRYAGFINSGCRSTRVHSRSILPQDSSYLEHPDGRLPASVPAPGSPHR
jgi:predicted acyl esterase